MATFCFYYINNSETYFYPKLSFQIETSQLTHTLDVTILIKH